MGTLQPERHKYFAQFVPKSTFVFCCQPYHLHGNGAAAADHVFRADILPDSTAESDNIKAGMMLKSLIFKSNNTLLKFLRKVWVMRKMPLAIRSYCCTE